MRNYNFDESCEFIGTTKEEVIERMEQWNNNKINIPIGKYTCNIHPLIVNTYEKLTGHTFEEILGAVIDEFAKGGDETDALKNIYKLYGDTFDENNVDDISETIDYVMNAIADDWYNVKNNNYKKANCYAEMLLRDNEDLYIKYTTGESVPRRNTQAQI